MQLFLMAALAVSLSVSQEPAGSVTCIPARYVQVQDGKEYDRVDCKAARRTNPQCSAREYDTNTLQITPLAYTFSNQIPPQGEYLGRTHLLIDRGTGAFQFVVIATTANDPAWHNVKTFSGYCRTAVGTVPL